MKQLIHASSQVASGRYKVQVVNSRTGQIVEERPWAKNLILNNGLDGIALRSWADSFTYCAAGTGNTPTQLDSGATTATQSTTSVTSSANFFQNSDIGSLIRWDSGALAVITGYTSATQVTVSNSATVSAGQFTLYRIDQTGLFTEISRSTGYLSGAGNCGTSYVANTVKMKRTYEFDPEGSSRNYAELGFSWDNAPGQNCFSRVLIEGGAVTVQTDFQLRVIYELSVTITPNTPTSRTASITGWLNRVASVTTNNAGSGGTPGTYALGVSGGNGSAFAGTYTIGGGGTITAITITNPGYGYTVAPSLAFPSGSITGASATANLSAWTQGYECVQAYGLAQVNESGGTAFGSSANEPSNAGLTNLSEASDVLASFGTSDGRAVSASKANTLATYSQGSHLIDKTTTFNVLEGNSTAIRAMSLAGGQGSDGVAFTYLFDNQQTKLDTHRLTLIWWHTWGRTF